MRGLAKRTIQYTLFWVITGVIFFYSPDGVGQTSLSIEVLREGRTLEQEEVAKILKTAFQSLYPERRFRVEVKSIQAFERIELPSGMLICELLLSEQGRRGGTISASLHFRSHGREVGKTRVSARVEISTEVLVAGHYLGKYQEIQEKDIQWVSRSLNLLPPDYLTEKREVIGKRVTIAVNRGEVLRAGIVEEPPLVKRGDRVVLLLENPQIRITTLGEVKEEGRRGDRIRLINLSSKKEVTGKVLNEHTVEVDF